jgi:hypothetical protein
MEPPALGSATREDYDRREMRPASSRIVAVILAAGLVTIAAGCGGGGKKSSSSTSPVAGAVSTTLTLTGTTGSSGSTASFASAKNCQDMAGLAAKAAAAVEASGNPTSALQTEATELQALAKAAPSDISADFQTFATAFSGFLHTLEQAGYKLGSKTPPTAAQIAALTKAARSFDTPKLRQAEQHLSAWARQNCKGVHAGG